MTVQDHMNSFLIKDVTLFVFKELQKSNLYVHLHKTLTSIYSKIKQVNTNI